MHSKGKGSKKEARGGRKEFWVLCGPSQTNGETTGMGRK